MASAPMMMMQYSSSYSADASSSNSDSFSNSYSSSSPVTTMAASTTYNYNYHQTFQMTPPPSSCGVMTMAATAPQGSHVDDTTSTMEMQRHQQMLRELAAAPLHQEPDDFEDFMTRLPRAEDFGLQGFQEVPPEVFDEAAAI